MHIVQEKLLELLKDQGSVPLRYREIGRKIGEKYPQTVKHHIEILRKNDLIIEQNGFLKLNSQNIEQKKFLTLPFYGLANCGEATVFADDKIKGFIKISRSIFPSGSVNNYFILQASGNSMNKAGIGHQKQSIEDGDFVIVDKGKINPENGDYVVSVIEECANIKKFSYDKMSEQVQLLAESSDEYFPIIMHKSDDFHVMGTVIGVIKKK
jgi:SOS-response transcriptional repressor LexA